ncbi:MAG: Fe-S-cluster containining protein, partial [Myxococcota bacterium]
QAASVDLAADSITFLPGTAHNCVACGASCGGHDVGPIAQHQVSAIKDAVPTARFVERHTQSEDTTGHYCAMEGDQCVFLRGDRLCSIHATLGLDPKPTDCRVFPLAFTRTPQGVVAGVRLECRSYLESKDNGGALAERGAELAHLAGAVDSMEEVAPLVRLDASTTLPWADYALLEQSLINAIAGPVVWRGLLAFNDRARALISVAQEADRAGQVFPADAVTSESPDPGPLWDDLVSGCQEAARLNRAAGKTARADRFERVSRGLQALRAGPIHCPPLGPRDDEILADHLRQSLFLKDAITGSSLRFGLGLLNLTVLLAVALVSLDGMSLNHALADVLKALRANPVSGPLHRADEAVAAWLHDDLEGRVAH